MKTKDKKIKNTAVSFPMLFVGDTNLPVDELGNDVCRAVETALYIKATGYTVVEKRVEQGNSDKTVETEKHHPPDLAAIKYLLNNRFPDKWQDKPDTTATENRDFCVIFGEYDENGNLIVPKMKGSRKDG